MVDTEALRALAKRGQVYHDNVTVLDLIDEIERLQAKGNDRRFYSVLAERDAARAERDDLAVTVARVRGMAVTAPPLMTKSGYVAGVVSASALLAAIKGETHARDV